MSDANSTPPNQTLYSSRVKYGLMFGVMIPGTALFIAARVLDPEAASLIRQRPYLELVFIGLIALGVAVMLYSLYRMIRPSELTLDADGFSFVKNLTKQRCSWAECSNFRTVLERAPKGGMRVIVQFDRKGGHVQFDRAGGKKSPQKLPENYRLPPQELADGMNRWREAALKRAAKPH